MKNKAMDQAKRIGANIIQKTDDGATKFTRYRYIASMYYLREPFLTDFKIKSDSIRLATKKFNSAFCILHFKNYMYKSDTPIYFDDSLSGYCKGATKKKGGFDIYRLDLKVDRDGIISDRNNLKSKRQQIIPVKKGNEYFINLMPCKSRGVCFVFVDKQQF
jgi:hypothetical protein